MTDKCRTLAVNAESLGVGIPFPRNPTVKKCAGRTEISFQTQIWGIEKDGEEELNNQGRTVDD